MNNNKGYKFFLAMLIIGLFLASVLVVNWGSGTDVLAQKSRVKAPAALLGAEANQQPLYNDYRGVRLGMTADETRAKLGEPMQKADDQDFYAFSEKETAQICYDASHQVVTISVDYIGAGSGAPDYKSIIGREIQTRPDGSLYQLVRYVKAGFWVSYNRTGGPSPVVTVTLQKLQ